MIVIKWTNIISKIKNIAITNTHTHYFFLKYTVNSYIFTRVTENKDNYFYSSSLLVMWQVVESMFYLDEWISRYILSFSRFTRRIFDTKRRKQIRECTSNKIRTYEKIFYERNEQRKVIFIYNQWWNFTLDNTMLNLIDIDMI